MELLDKIDMYLLSEAKVVVTPYGKTAVGRQEKWTKEEIADAADKLGAVISDEFKYEITLGKSRNADNLIFYRKDNSSIERDMDDDSKGKYVTDMTAYIEKAGYKVVSQQQVAGWVAFVIDKK